MANQILSNNSKDIELKTKLKAYALKAFAQYNQQQNNSVIQTMQAGLKLDANDVMSQLKISIFYLLLLPEAC